MSKVKYYNFLLPSFHLTVEGGLAVCSFDAHLSTLQEANYLHIRLKTKIFHSHIFTWLSKVGQLYVHNFATHLSTLKEANYLHIRLKTKIFHSHLFTWLLRVGQLSSAPRLKAVFRW